MSYMKRELLGAIERGELPCGASLWLDEALAALPERIPETPEERVADAEQEMLGQAVFNFCDISEAA